MPTNLVPARVMWLAETLTGKCYWVKDAHVCLITAREEGCCLGKYVQDRVLAENVTRASLLRLWGRPISNLLKWIAQTLPLTRNIIYTLQRGHILCWRTPCSEDLPFMPTAVTRSQEKCSPPCPTDTAGQSGDRLSLTGLAGRRKETRKKIHPSASRCVGYRAHSAWLFERLPMLLAEADMDKR